MNDPDVSATKKIVSRCVAQMRVTTTMRHVLKFILEDRFPGEGEEIFLFVDNRKVSLDAPIAMTRFAEDPEETVDE